MWKGDASTHSCGGGPLSMKEEETGPLISRGPPGTGGGAAEYKPHLDSFITLVLCLSFYSK